ncbi:V-type proton ATPase subunit E 1-like [Dysidea avara]|uniref:V-type proton ATPase subunit E 1-like n=1 Tax=Dysidea avara TaxID=196820 RepID=UPI00332D4BF7
MLTDQEVDKQIEHMKSFIEKEAQEKAEEILAKAEEEFNIERGRLFQQEKLKIMSYFERKEKQIEMQRKIQRSNLLNQARIATLKAQDDHIQRIMEETRVRLGDIRKNESKYKEMLKGLLTQGMCQLLEPEVQVSCRKDDVKLLQSIIKSSCSAYKEATGKECTVQITESFLPDDCAGGMDLYTQKGKIKVTNTLESRLELLGGQMLPEMRTMLCGRNPNRRFLD